MMSATKVRERSLPKMGKAKVAVAVQVWATTATPRPRARTSTRARTRLAASTRARALVAMANLRDKSGLRTPSAWVVDPPSISYRDGGQFDEAFG